MADPMTDPDGAGNGRRFFAVVLCLVSLLGSVLAVSAEFRHRRFLAFLAEASYDDIQELREKPFTLLGRKARWPALGIGAISFGGFLGLGRREQPRFFLLLCAASGGFLFAALGFCVLP